MISGNILQLTSAQLRLVPNKLKNALYWRMLVYHVWIKSSLFLGTLKGFRLVLGRTQLGVGVEGGYEESSNSFEEPLTLFSHSDFIPESHLHLENLSSF